MKKRIEKFSGMSLKRNMLCRMYKHRPEAIITTNTQIIEKYIRMFIVLSKNINIQINKYICKKI